MKIYNIAWHLQLSFLVTLPIIAPAYSQTCRYDVIKQVAPDKRYKNNNNQTITDKVTGLMWKRCSEGQTGTQCESGADIFTAGEATIFNWLNGLQYVETLNNSGGFASYTNWRLPNRKELESLVEIACVTPSINITMFPNTPSISYWSSSTQSFSNTINAWGIDFGTGNSINSFDTERPIRLVRDN